MRTLTTLWRARWWIAATVVSFLLWTALFLVVEVGLVGAQIPLATDVDRAQSQMAISLDGTEFTFRGVALNSTRICVEPATGKFGPRRCFTVGDVRDGLVIKR